MKKMFFILLFCFLNNHGSFAQCAMCKQNAETSLKEGNTTAAGINVGILYLLVIPYMLVGGIGYYWYKKNKEVKEENTNL